MKLRGRPELDWYNRIRFMGTGLEWREVNGRLVTILYARRFGFEHTGARFELAAEDLGDPEEAFLRIWIVEGDRAIRLDRMEQLRGHVAIRSEQDALRFARLRTVPRAFRCWRDGDIITEIVDITEANQLVELWIPPVNSNGLERKLRPDYSTYADGWDGFLMHSAFEKCGFCQPRVKRSLEGFTVERWLLIENFDVNDPSPQAALVRETVGPDGAYSRKTLISKDASQLPGVRLRILRGL
jgi:hypothetical protein